MGLRFKVLIFLGDSHEHRSGKGREGAREQEREKQRGRGESGSTFASRGLPRFVFAETFPAWGDAAALPLGEGYSSEKKKGGEVAKVSLGSLFRTIMDVQRPCGPALWA